MLIINIARSKIFTPYNKKGTSYAMLFTDFRLQYPVEL